MLLTHMQDVEMRLELDHWSSLVMVKSLRFLVHIHGGTNGHCSQKIYQVLNKCPEGIGKLTASLAKAKLDYVYDRICSHFASIDRTKQDRLRRPSCLHGSG